MPSYDFHCPVGEIPKFVLEEMKSRQELTVVSGKFRSEFASQSVLVGYQCVTSNKILFQTA